MNGNYFDAHYRMMADGNIISENNMLFYPYFETKDGCAYYVTEDADESAGVILMLREAGKEQGSLVFRSDNFLASNAMAEDLYEIAENPGKAQWLSTDAEASLCEFRSSLQW